MSKKSSIEQLELDLEIWFAITKIYFPVEIKNSIERSKAMHKQEIEFSYNCGWADGHDEATNESPLFTTGEQYYNETFGGQDNE
jgi:hypothetical protein